MAAKKTRAHVKFNPDCPSCRADKRRRDRMAVVKEPATVLPPFIMTEWIVSRSLSKSDLSKGGVGLVYHVQARTADQFSSVATLVGEKAPLTRQKGADGVTDVFTCMSDQGHTTMNIVGKIRYEGDWPK